MKKPKYLFHGSRDKIKILEPRKPTDIHPDHCKKAVYATDSKLDAISHGIATKRSKCFRERGNPILCIIAGPPSKHTHKYSYLHILDPKDFKHNVRNEWITTKKVRPIKIIAYPIKKLEFLWRKSNYKELKEFLKDRNKWKIPKKENIGKQKINNKISELEKSGEAKVLE